MIYIHIIIITQDSKQILLPKLCATSSSSPVLSHHQFGVAVQSRARRLACQTAGAGNEKEKKKIRRFIAVCLLDR